MLLAKNINLLNIIIIILVGIQLLKLVISFVTNYIFNILNQNVIVSFKRDLFKKIIKLPLSFFDNNQTGYLMSRIGEADRLGYFFSNTFTRILISILEFIFCLFIIFYMHWKLALVSIIILPLFYLTSRYYSKGIRHASRELMEKGAKVSKQFQESLSGINTIKEFTAEKKETKKINENLTSYMQSSIASNLLQSISSEVLALFGIIGGIVVLWFGGSEIIKGSFTIGSYIAFSAYLGNLYGPTQTLSGIGIMFQPAITAIHRIKELTDLSGEENDKGIKIANIKGDVEFKNVNFSYNSKDVITEINLKIKYGEKILITGPNGSGKSTLVKLLLGLYSIKKGKLLINNYRINDISLSSLRERISIVSQHTFLFNDTIKNNIIYSKPAAKEEEFINAAKLAGISKFIKKLENGYDTNIG